MKESLIRELCRIQDTLKQFISYELWQEWAAINEKVLAYLQAENHNYYKKN